MKRKLWSSPLSPTSPNASDASTLDNQLCHWARFHISWNRLLGGLAEKRRYAEQRLHVPSSSAGIWDFEDIPIANEITRMGWIENGLEYYSAAPVKVTGRQQGKLMMISETFSFLQWLSDLQFRFEATRWHLQLHLFISYYMNCGKGLSFQSLLANFSLRSPPVTLRTPTFAYQCFCLPKVYRHRNIHTPFQILTLTEC